VTALAGGPDAVRSVTRALHLLSAFDDEHAELSVTDLVDRTALPKTTVLRLAQTLERNGFLFRRGDGVLCLGPVLIRLSHAVDVAWKLPPAAEATMASLRDRTRETVNLYVLQGLSRVCVAQQQGPQPVRYVIPMGVQLPLWVGASGKVLLSGSSPAFVSEVLRAAGKDDGFARRLEAQLARVREIGHAVSRDEREQGVASVAAPIRGRGGRTIAALAISGPSPRFTEERAEEFGRFLQAGVEEVAAALAASTTGFAAGGL
jgi:DNA-binding IclR family transcriptional regulator